MVKYLSKLGNKNEDKIIITCRAGYVDEDDIKSIFMPRSKLYEKVYIAKVKEEGVKEYI